MTLPVVGTRLSGERFEATYRLRTDAASVEALAQLICYEHTVETAPELVPAGPLLDHVVGQVASIVDEGQEGFVCRISYAAEMAADGLPNLLGLVMGNAGFFPQVELVGLELSPSVLKHYGGPRFGIAGVRKLLGRPSGLLSGTALKPMGATPAELANIAVAFARGGIDVIKEDDGLTNQSTAPFKERVLRCADAVRETSERCGRSVFYVPNITGPIDQLLERAHFAREAGASGVELVPGLTGLDAVRLVSADIDLPVFTHSAWNGALSRPASPAVSFPIVHGFLPRLAGGDVSITPTFLGRFGLALEDCKAMSLQLAMPAGHLKPTFAMPGGGIGAGDIDKVASVYGEDCIVLVSGALFAPGETLEARTRHFADLVRACPVRSPAAMEP